MNGMSYTCLKVYAHRAAVAAAASAVAARSIGMHCATPKSVPDPFQAATQAAQCIPMDLATAAAARCA